MLAEVGETYAPKGATAIVMDPRNSQVLAMANWPPVDPADLSEASTEDLLNRATGFTYEPGSTFKAFTVSAALEEKMVTPDDRPSRCRRQLQVADRTIEDAEARGDRDADASPTILAHSSNVGAVDDRPRGRAPRNSAAGSTASASAARPGSSSRPRSRGSCPTLDEYSGSTMGNLPIGQGLSVTPIQMVAGYTAIANGGILRPPQLIKKVGGEPVARAARAGG